MTSRQARTQRRAAERKAKKAEIKRQKAAAALAAARLAIPELPIEEEFSPELIAEANAARERIHRAAGIAQIPAPGFVSQRAAINRANAQHSTGPTSPAGKLASSRNSLQHGLASGQIIMPGEDPSEFKALLNDLITEHHPATTTEELLIQEMAQSYWLTQRALRLQNECFTGDGIDEKRLALFLRYQTTHERAFHKALTALLKLQKERARNFKSGFVSQNTAEHAPEIGFVSQNAPDCTAAPPENPSEEQSAWQNRQSEAA